MKYDDAGWHYDGGDFPPGSPLEYGAVHIGVFVRLMFERGMIGELHTSNWPDDVKKLLDGEWTGTDFVMNIMDGKMTSEDFDAEGNKFARSYYEQGTYYGDFAEYSGVELYEAPESDVNMDAMEDIFEIRLEAFQKTGDPKKEVH